jgi:hypothetical protein
MNAARAVAADLAPLPRLTGAPAVEAPRPWIARPHNTLTAWMRGRNLSPDAALAVAAALTAEIRKLHDQARTHGQIDPDHVVITSVGVELLPERVGYEDVPVTAYTAPEILRGDGPGPLADLYSLGAVIYTLCSGRMPFLTSDPEELRYEILTFAPDPLCSGLPGANLRTGQFLRSVEQLIVACMDKVPARRPQRLVRVQQELEALRTLARELATPEPEVEREPEPEPASINIEFRADPGLTKQVAGTPIRLPRVGLLPIDCPRCLGPWVYESRPRTRFEGFALSLGVDLCRCHQCFHRFLDFGWFRTSKSCRRRSRASQRA